MSDLKFVFFTLSFIFCGCVASLVPAVVNFKVTSRGRIIFKKTQVTHGANLQQIVSCPSALKKFCEDYARGNPSGNISENSEGETENSRTLGKLMFK